MIDTSNIIPFWKTGQPHGYMSQWYSAKYTLDGVTYENVEQGLMKAKADAFNDAETGAKILQTNDPKRIKDLGRQVKGFKDDIWIQKRTQISLEHNIAKFTQNHALLQLLLDTQEATLVEASPYDRIWGIGFAPNDPRVKSPGFWPKDKGKPNPGILGIVLMKVRDTLRK